VSTASIDRVIAAHPGAFARPGVIGVRAGYEAVAGWVTPVAAIVVTVLRKRDDLPAAERLPDTLEGIPVDVRQASRLEALRASDPALFLQAVAQLQPEQQLATFPSERLVRPAGQLAALPEAFAAHAKPRLAYTPPAGRPLSPIDAHVAVTCHASPDAGWPTLKAFLGATEQQLTVGLYDFTSAHVLAGVERALAGKQLDMVLDHPAPNPTRDQTDEQTRASLEAALGSGTRMAWALEAADPFAAVAIFPNAYHIKVAVRDRASFWLSSGNWNNSNQPDIDPVHVSTDVPLTTTCDRDWHVIVEHPGLSQTFAAYIEHDLEVAAAHQVAPPPAAATPALADVALANVLSALDTPALPAHAYGQVYAPRTYRATMRISPLLTPDAGVYVDAVHDLVASAQTTLYIQTQYAHVSADPADAAFAGLLAAVAARQQAGVDVRIIFSQWQTQPYLEKLQAAGLALSGVRIQQGVHNKGIVRDGTAVLVSSQNWSADAVLRNRDAGLLIEHPPIARYFERIFLHDWDDLAHQTALEG
jgi:hypothetical protein